MCDGPYGSEEAFSCNAHWANNSTSLDDSEAPDLDNDNAPRSRQHSIPEQLNERTDNYTASEWIW